MVLKSRYTLLIINVDEEPLFLYIVTSTDYYEKLALSYLILFTNPALQFDTFFSTVIITVTSTYLLSLCAKANVQAFHLLQDKAADL